MIGEIFGLIGRIVEPITKMIDNVVTSDEERLQLHNQLVQLQLTWQQQLLDYETKLAEQKAKIVQAEAEGQSWLQRNWRPITMMVFVVIVAWNYIIAPLAGLEMLPMPDQLWDLLQIGIGGYIAGRSIEKVAPMLADAFSKRKE